MQLVVVARVFYSSRMDALTKLFETGLKVGVPNATMRALFTKTRKGRSAGHAAHNALSTASRKAIKAGPTEEQKAEAREKAKKKREEEAAKKRAAAVETKRKANARKAEAAAAKQAEINAAVNRKPFESIKVVHEKVIVEKNIPRGSPIPNGFVRVGRSNRGNTIRIRGNLGPQMNNLANRLMKTIKVRRNRK